MNSGRLSGRVEQEDANHQVRSGGEVPSANDSQPVPGGAPRITAAQAARLAASLTDQDRQVVEVLAQVRVASGGHLRRLLWPDTQTGHRLARHHLAKLTKLRILARLGRQVGGVRSGSTGHTYCLDVAGLRIVNADLINRVRRPSSPSDLFVDHLLGVTETLVALREGEKAGALELVAFADEPGCWRDYPGPAGRPLTLKPDAYAEWRDSEWEEAAFIEIDMSTEHPGRLTRKGARYLAYWRTGIEQATSGMFPAVIWIAPTQRRVHTIKTALGQLDTDELFTVTTPEGFALDLQSTRKERR